MNFNILIVLVLATLCALTLMSENKKEGFHIGEPRYGLRGDLIKTSDIRYKYIYPENHFRVDKSPGVMYESRFPPHLKIPI
jgi:signal peptidase I